MPRPWYDEDQSIVSSLGPASAPPRSVVVESAPLAPAGAAPFRVEGFPKPGASGMCSPVVCARGMRGAAVLLAAADDPAAVVVLAAVEEAVVAGLGVVEYLVVVLVAG